MFKPKNGQDDSNKTTLLYFIRGSNCEINVLSAADNCCSSIVTELKNGNIFFFLYQIQQSLDCAVLKKGDKNSDYSNIFMIKSLNALRIR